MFNDLSLSSIFQMRHGLLKKGKKEREKMACPRSMTQKKIGTHEGPSVEKKIGHMKVQEKKGNIYVAMPSCYPNKRERDS